MAGIMPCARLVTMRASVSLVLLVACLEACSRHGDEAAQAAQTPAVAAAAAPIDVTAPAAPASSQPAVQETSGRHAWMRAVFRDAYDAGAGRALMKGDPGSEQQYAMTLAAEKVLPDGRIALVVNGAEADEHGNTDEMIGSTTPGTLNVYILQPADGGWTVAERHDRLDDMGRSGWIGDIAWIDLGAGKPGFIVTSTDANRGQSVTNAVVHELGHGVRQVASFRVSNDITDACWIEHEVCWDIQGAIRIDTPAAADAYADILLDFRGKRFRVSEGDDGGQVEHLLEPIDQTARYRFDGKAYILSSGTNPAEDG